MINASSIISALCNSIKLYVKSILFTRLIIIYVTKFSYSIQVTRINCITVAGRHSRLTVGSIQIGTKNSAVYLRRTAVVGNKTADTKFTYVPTCQGDRHLKRVVSHRDWTQDALRPDTSLIEEK